MRSLQLARQRTSFVARNLPKVLAAAVIFGLFVVSRQPSLSDAQTAVLAARFRFEPIELTNAGEFPQKTVRAVHPSLKNVAGMISFVGAAVAIGDLDGDGLPNDLVHIDPRTDRVTVAPVPQIRSETADVFKPFVLDPQPLSFDSETTAPAGCMIGDYNEDGLSDIIVCFWGRSPILFLRRDGSQFLARDQFVAIDLITPIARWYTSAMIQADFDGDGHLDLMFGNYFPDGSHVLDANGTGTEQMPDSISRAFNGGHKRLFLWQGGRGGTEPNANFRLAENAIPSEIDTQWTFGFAAADLDGDLLPELYAVHDWGADRLLHNRSKPGQVQFAVLTGNRSLTTPRSKVLGLDTFSGMGVDVGDLNGDGWLDLFVSNITVNGGLHESNFAFLSTGAVDLMRDGIAPYRDESEVLGLSRGGWTWEARLADFDNDGILEVMQAAGFQKGRINRWPEIQEFALANDRLVHDPRFWPNMAPGDEINGNDRNPFFVRAASGRYFDLSKQVGIPAGMLTRGIATADVDGDGRLDIVVANQWAPSYFFHNTASGAGAFLGLRLLIPVGNAALELAETTTGSASQIRSRPAIGAQAKVHLPDGRILTAQVDGGTGHSGKRAPDLHFGLGMTSTATRIRADLSWRGTDGRRRAKSVNLNSGWHTILLSDSTPPESLGQ